MLSPVLALAMAATIFHHPAAATLKQLCSIGSGGTTARTARGHSRSKERRSTVTGAGGKQLFFLTQRCPSKTVMSKKRRPLRVGQRFPSGVFIIGFSGASLHHRFTALVAAGSLHVLGSVECVAQEQLTTCLHFTFMFTWIEVKLKCFARVFVQSSPSMRVRKGISRESRDTPTFPARDQRPKSML